MLKIPRELYEPPNAHLQRFLASKQHCEDNAILHSKKDNVVMSPLPSFVWTERPRNSVDFFSLYAGLIKTSCF